MGGVVANHGELNPFRWNWSQVTTYLGVVVGGVVGYACAYGIVNPGTFGYTFGVSNALGAAGLTIGAAGSLSNWSFRWSTAAGGGGKTSFNFNGVAANERFKDSRFVQTDWDHAVRLLVSASRRSRVEMAMYETEYGYYFEDTEGYMILSGATKNSRYKHVCTRPNGQMIYYTSNTFDAASLYHVADIEFGSGVFYPYLDLGCGQRVKILRMYHTHPQSTHLSPDDPYQGIIPTYAVGWDGISRGALPGNRDDGYLWPEVIISGNNAGKSSRSFDGLSEDEKYMKWLMGSFRQ